MNIAVCVKQIPDPATPYELDPETNWIQRPEDQILDDTDRYGVELGLQLAEAAGDDSTVTVFSMSPAGSLQGIRQALAMGADKAVVVADENLRGSAALVTAQVLAAAIKAEGFDIVLAGTESTDGYTGVVPQQLAELLGVPALTYARKVEVSNGKVRVEQQTAAGFDVIESDPPVVVTVTAGAVEPRYPSFKGIMAAKSKAIEQPTAADLGFDASQVGAAGSAQDIEDVSAVPARQAGEVIEDEGTGHERIVALLEEVKVL